MHACVHMLNAPVLTHALHMLEYSYTLLDIYMQILVNDKSYRFV